MPTPTFKRISRDQFAQLLEQFPFERKINAVHMHHTWRPSRRDFRGHETIVSMWRYHTQQNGWRDIAQHITIDPEGFIWLGRNWNLPPASAAGHNGNDRFGPFMFEMIGDFDIGRDPFDGPQRSTAVGVIALVQARFGLEANTLAFHNAMSSKSCPGSSIDYDEVLAEVKAARRQHGQDRGTTDGVENGPTRRSPFPHEADPDILDAIDALRRRVPPGIEPADAEHAHADHQRRDGAWPPDDEGRRVGVRLTPEELAALQPHVVNLSMGRFSKDGAVATTKADVDAIFEVHLPNALTAAQKEGRKLQLLFYAHGGLVSESSGLEIAIKHIDWWKQNNVYPIYFVWETGFFETIGNLLQRAQEGTRRGVPRDIFDYTLDPLIELSARALRGPSIWGSMKSSAEHAVDERGVDGLEGGAHYLAKKLADFCSGKHHDIALHAIGHSAGAIFHSYFLPTARALDVPTFESAYFFAPAVRVDTFKRQLAGGIGPGKAVERLTMFTMSKYLEKDDNCAGIYHKSLLYLIFHALEQERGTPILGMEESVRSDPDLKALFGLAGTSSNLGEVIWSRTPADTGRSSSTASTHGGFDDDAPTMNSTLRRILGKADADHIKEYPVSRSRVREREWTEEVDWPEGVIELRRASQPIIAAGDVTSGGRTARASAPAHAGGSAAGRRLALCVGINAYPNPDHRLQGCVADARLWADTLTRQGFSSRLLLDRAATRAAIDAELRALVRDSRPGDVLVFQYSGHGTYTPDLHGDEVDGKDEALCPVDFADGALYIDDDIAEVFAAIPDSVNVTCFMDCCHSGTNTRFAVGLPSSVLQGRDGARRRFVPPTPELVQAHRLFRQSSGRSARTVGSGGSEQMRNIVFSACLDEEVAWERNGQGDFTLRATRILQAGIDRLSHEQFLQRVIADFGAQPSQHPRLDCAQAAMAGFLLQPVVAYAGAAAPMGLLPNGRMDGALLPQAIGMLQELHRQIGGR